jgi:hypothetical protein
MKTNLVILSLLGLGIFSCSSSCASCSQETVQSPASQGVGGHNSSYPVLEGSGSVALNTSSSSTGMELPPVTSGPPLTPVTSGSLDVCTSACDDLSGSDKDRLYSGESWQLYLSTDFKLQKPKQPNIELSMLSSEKNLLVVILKDPMMSTYDQYVLGSVRSYKDGGATVISTKEVMLGSSKFTLLEVNKGTVKIFNYITYKNGAGYVLSCGGPPPYDNVIKNCPLIANHFHIK